MRYRLEACVILCLLFWMGRSKLYVMEIREVTDEGQEMENILTQEQVLDQLSKNFQQLTKSESSLFYRLSQNIEPDPQLSTITPNADEMPSQQMEEESLTGKLPDSGTNTQKTNFFGPRQKTRPDPNAGTCNSFGDFPLGEPIIVSSLQARRTYFLGLINEIRTRVGLLPLVLNEKLSQAAQQHTEDMVKNNFFSHANPQGESPMMRAAKNGYYCPVGENIVNSFSVTEGSETLRRSASHYPNIVDGDFTEVGLGIKDDFSERGLCRVYMTQLFGVSCGLNQQTTQQTPSSPQTEIPSESTPTPGTGADPPPKARVLPPPTIPDIAEFEQDIAGKIMESNGYTAIYDSELSLCFRGWLASDQTLDPFDYIVNICTMDVTNLHLNGIIKMNYDSSAAAFIASQQFTRSPDSSYNYIAVSVVVDEDDRFSVVIAYDKK